MDRYVGFNGGPHPDLIILPLIFLSLAFFLTSLLPLTDRQPSGTFQSSSSPKAGCNLKILNIMVLISSFNPHPARRLDAILLSSCMQGKDLVSILIQPEGWMQYGRWRRSNRWTRFQSSSSPKAGCNQVATLQKAAGICFNPHPARRLDAMNLVCGIH